MPLNSDDTLAVVCNIPPSYHSADLRNYFSSYVETEQFKCFHFRHRLESADLSTYFCCPFVINSQHFTKLQKLYHRKHWISKNDDLLPDICIISKLSLSGSTKVTSKGAMFSAEAYHNLVKLKEGNYHSVLSIDYTESDLKELSPPDIMPQGNIGTATKHFLTLIKNCQLPPVIIKKLQLKFSKTYCGKYSNVPFSYGDFTNDDSDDDEAFTGSGDKLLNKQEYEIRLDELNQQKSTKQLKSEGIEEKMIGQKANESDSDDDHCEQWERYESLFDDPQNIERNKERLYEEELELVWEKGGPGLLFYTDSQYWRKQEGDFDEQTADDWEIDTTGYYDPGMGDKDNEDTIQMKREQRDLQGIGTSCFKKIGTFEKHTKGIGRRVLERYGWQDGSGVGKKQSGIAEAIDSVGQSSRSKAGFGFKEPVTSLLNRSKPKKQKKAHIMNTKYDDVSLSDPTEPLRRRNPPHQMKYRGHHCDDD